jgi:hypothetical protein
VAGNIHQSLIEGEEPAAAAARLALELQKMSGKVSEAVSKVTAAEAKAAASEKKAVASEKRERAEHIDASAARQGLTLVHLSAEVEPFSSIKPPNVSLTKWSRCDQNWMSVSPYLGLTRGLHSSASEIDMSLFMSPTLPNLSTYPTKAYVKVKSGLARYPQKRLRLS